MSKIKRTSGIRMARPELPVVEQLETRLAANCLMDLCITAPVAIGVVQDQLADQAAEQGTRPADARIQPPGLIEQVVRSGRQAEKKGGSGHQSLMRVAANVVHSDRASEFLPQQLDRQPPRPIPGLTLGRSEAGSRPQVEMAAGLTRQATGTTAGEPGTQMVQAQESARQTAASGAERQVLGRFVADERPRSGRLAPTFIRASTGSANAISTNPEAAAGRAENSTAQTPQDGMPAHQGGIVSLAGAHTDLIVPYQRIRYEPSSKYHGQFVVQLAEGVESSAVAAAYGATEEFAYPHLPNIRLWNTSLEGSRTVEAGRSNRPEKLAARLRSDPAIIDAYPVYNSPTTTMGLPNDPLLPAQWHLYNTGQTGGTSGLDGNVQAAWDLGITGRGATVGVVDTGSQTTADGQQALHPDLASQFVAMASYDFTGGDDNPTTSDAHGTAVAGVAVAAGNNGIGVSGVAPNGLFGAIHAPIEGIGDEILDDKVSQALDWDTFIAGQFDASLIDIYNNSWGPGLDGKLYAERPLTQAAIRDSAINGRGGLGSIYLWAAGNGRSGKDNVNYNGFANNRHSITVAALGHAGVLASYSTPGAAILVSAPSRGAASEGITTTDMTGSSGYARTSYTDSFSGTSSATPYVSGVVALMLEANPDLSWRDVQHILVQSANLNDSGSSGWALNGANRHIHNDYGFGIVNASGAVTLASNWQPVGPELVADSARIEVNQAIPDNNTIGISNTFSLVPNLRVEHVEVVFNATHANRGQLEVILTSPSGTQSVLAANRDVDNNPNYNHWLFTSARHWDEFSAGDWTLNVRDQASGTTGTFGSWQLRVYGTAATGDTSGPRVTGLASTNGFINGGSVSSFQIQFDEPIDPASLDTSDITFQRVGGSPIPISTITAVAKTGNRVFNVTFASQSSVGNYRVDIGPNITDAGGVSMNQDADAANGEPIHDRYTEFFTLADRFLYSNTTSGTIPDSSSLIRSVTLPAVTIADLNLSMTLSHAFASRDLTVSLASPGGTSVLLADRNAANTSGGGGNGYRDTTLDDDNAAAPSISATNNGLLHYVDQYRPTNPLSSFDGSHPAGDWTLTIADNVAGDAGTLNYFSLVITPANASDIRIDTVSNMDADRDKIELTYTITGAEPAADVPLVIYRSSDPFFNIQSDTQTGVATLTGADLAPGTRTIKLDRSLFPDPNLTANSMFYSLIVADPHRTLLDDNRSNNYAILTGVTQTADGTLYVASQPFASNSITVTNSDITLNGSVIGYDPGVINDIVITGGRKSDTIGAAGVSKSIFVALGAGNDTYSGGDGTDVVLGGPGHDHLAGGQGNDRIFGMIGNDTVLGESGDDLVNAGEGGVVDLAEGAAIHRAQSVDGGPGSDRLYINGTMFNDRITVWDPDGNNDAMGSTLVATVGIPATLDPATRMTETDQFGYSAAVHTYEAIDLVPGATNVLTVLDGTDDGTALLDLGADKFTLYGVSHTGAASLCVSANGFITFGGCPSSTLETNGDLVTSPTQAAVAAFWDNLTTGADSSGSATDDGVLRQFQDLTGDGINDRLVIEWNAVRLPGGSVSEHATFQLILQLNTGALPGSITFNYRDTTFGAATAANDARLATIGLKDSGSPQRNRRIAVAENGTGPGASFIDDNRAIRIAIDPGASQAILIANVAEEDRLFVGGGPGDDLIQLEQPMIPQSRVRLPSTLVGGTGNDTIFDGLGVDDLYGDRDRLDLPGDGNDVLDSSDGSHGDALHGGGGADLNQTPELADDATGFETWQDESEPNSTHTTANVVSISYEPLIVRGTIAGDDPDYFRFSLTQRSAVYFDIDSVETGLSTTLDSELTVFDSTGTATVPGGNNDDGRDFDGFDLEDEGFTQLSADSALYIELAPGTYFVRVSPFSSSTDGSYHLKMVADADFNSGIPALNSKPGASDTLYLDFNGHTSSGDAWKAEGYTAGAYDFNGNAAEISPGERMGIRNIWRTVAEDFSPFNINVTTVDPGSFENGVAFRQVITNSSPSLFNLASNTLGVAYLNSYASGANDNVAFTFAAGFGDYVSEAGLSGEIMAKTIEIANTSSHEFGHALTLRHFVQSNETRAIMHTPEEGLNRERWFSGMNSESVVQDDMAVISNLSNTIGYRIDDHGDSISAATVLIRRRGVYAAAGVIAQLTDRDFFSFAAFGTTVRLAVEVDRYLADLDAELILYDAAGTVIASHDPTGTNALGASLVLHLAPGTYFAEVRSDAGPGEAGQYNIIVRV